MKWLMPALRVARPVVQPLVAAVIALQLAALGLPSECVVAVRAVLVGL